MDEYFSQKYITFLVPRKWGLSLSLPVPSTSDPNKVLGEAKHMSHFSSPQQRPPRSDPLHECRPLCDALTLCLLL